MRAFQCKSIPTFESSSFAFEVRGDDTNKKAVLLAGPYYRTFLNKKFKIGDKGTMILSSKKPKRTIAQNNYYWVYLALIQDETGNDSEDLHEYFKTKFLQKKIAQVFGKPVQKYASTTNLSRLDFGEYIDKIADETGIEPPPTENYL